MAAETTQSLNSGNCPMTSMIEDFRNQSTICSPDVSSIGKKIKANQLKNFSYIENNLVKKRGVFFYYVLWIVDLTSLWRSWRSRICMDADNVKEESVFVKTGDSNWENARSPNKGFQKHESLKRHQAAVQRLVEILKTTRDVSTKILSFIGKDYYLEGMKMSRTLTLNSS